MAWLEKARIALTQGKNPFDLAVAFERHAQQRAEISKLLIAMRGEVRIRQDIRNLHHGAGHCRAPHIGAEPGRNGVCASILYRSWEVVCGRQIEQIAAFLEDRPDMGPG